MEKYPYYIVEDIERYHELDPNTEEARRLALRISVNIGDKATRQRILGQPDSENSGEKREESKGKDSFDVIDSFLDKFGGNVAVPESLKDQATNPISGKQKLTGTGNLSAVTDIETREEEQKVISPLSEGDLEAGSEKEPRLGDLLREHRYQEAIQFIERQNLNNPQKSIYFAHQMRFIKKLIALEKYKTNRPLRKQ